MTLPDSLARGNPRGVTEGSRQPGTPNRGPNVVRSSSLLHWSFAFALLACSLVSLTAGADVKPGKSAADKAARAGKEDAEKAARADPTNKAADPADATDAKPGDAKPGIAKPGATGALSPNRGKKLKVEYVVAVVNDAIILNTELETRRLPALGEAAQITDPKERERRIAKLSSQVLDEMINEELIVQAADAAKIEVESNEVQAALDEIKQQNNLDDAGLSAALAAQGFTMAN